MRTAAMVFALAWGAWPQFKSTVPLVIAPTTITDSKGHFVDGLTPDDLILSDNSVAQRVPMDWMAYPISWAAAGSCSRSC